MIRQAASAFHSAWKNDHIHRQTIRIALSETMYGDKEESFVADRAIGWQGGPQETNRFLLPIAQQVLRQVSLNDEENTSGMTTKVQEQVLLNFDGSALLNGESPMGALYDSLALLQPNTDQYYSKIIRQMEEEFSDSPGKAKRLFLLVNPAWRDASSWGFLQHKKAKEQILDRYETTFALDQFIMKGNKISVLKQWPYDWCIYWTPLPQPGSSSSPSPKLLGTFPERPEYQAMEGLLVQELSNPSKD